MAYEVTVHSTKFVLCDNSDSTRLKVKELARLALDDGGADYYDDGFMRRIGENEAGQHECILTHSEEVGESFKSRIGKFVSDLSNSGLLGCAFSVVVRDCDSSSDDDERDAIFFGGPSLESINAFKAVEALKQAREILHPFGANLEVVAIMVQLDQLIDSNEKIAAGSELTKTLLPSVDVGTSSAQLWVRFGDRQNYEQYDSIDAVPFAEVMGGGVVVDEWQMYGFTASPGFDYQNYVSCFWGDTAGSRVRELSEFEREQVKAIVEQSVDAEVQIPRVVSARMPRANDTDPTP